MNLINGTELSVKYADELKNRIEKLDKKPALSIIQIGNNEASNIYIDRKVSFAEEIGAIANVINFAEDVSTEDIVETILNLNNDENINGIIVQLPIPKDLDKEKILNTIDPKKDVDGLTARNMWKLMDGDKSGMIPATARAIQILLDEYDVDIKGKHVVIVGDSILVGKSTMLYFLEKGATVTVCNEHTVDLPRFTREADILVTAVGKKDLIGLEHVTSKQVVIDVGIVRVGEKIHGDVDFENVKDHVSMITPVPGGVGPMTVLSLFENLIDSI